MGRNRSFLAAVVALASGCSDAPPGLRAVGLPAAMLITGGDGQLGVVAKELPAALAVKVVDSAGLAVPNQLVNFVVSSGGGSVFAGAAITNAAGEAREHWTLGTSTADTQRVEARAVDPGSGQKLVFAVFKATPTADVVSSIVKIAGDNQLVDPSGFAADSLAVRLRDQHNNPVIGATVTWSVSTGGGSISPTTKATDSSGVARTRLQVGTGGPQSVAATTGSLTAVTFGAAVFETFQNISVGQDYHTCGVAQRGTFCWGANGFQQLGTSQTATCPTLTYQYCMEPRPVGGTQQFVSVTTGGQHTCGLTAAGAAYCWGRNTSGQLGFSTAIDAIVGTPTAVTGGLTFQAISAGYIHTCGITTAGAAYCWGHWGFIGTGGGSDVSTPQPVAGGLTFTRLDAAEAHTCAITTSGSAHCWGNNSQGQLGAAGSGSTPIAVSGGLTFSRISAASNNYTCGITTAGAAYCWGNNANGVLGVPTSTTTSTSPVAVVGGLQFTEISAGTVHACALATTGTAYCWGRAGGGNLGTTDNFHHDPRAINSTLQFASISAGYFASCATTASGAAWCWGENSDGNLGTGNRTHAFAPVRVLPSPF